MPLQDLTPQLRTRLNRMERSVGWFIMLATVLLIIGFGYYLYKAAENRGWFKAKAPFYTYVESGSGLSIGDTVKLMGFDVGHITKVKPMPPTWGQQTSNNVYVEFEIVDQENFYYIWTQGSHVDLKGSGFLDKRVMNLTKGTNGYAVYSTQPIRDDLTVAEAEALPDREKWRLGQEIWDGTNLVLKAWTPLTNGVLEKITSLMGTNLIRVMDSQGGRKRITAVWNEQEHRYDRFTGTNIFGLDRREEVAVTDRLQAMVAQIQAALPSVLQMTNQIATVLSNSARITSNLDVVIESARPVVTNLAVISTQLRNPQGSLGEWLIPTNINQKLDLTLDSANGTLANVDTNLATLNVTLNNLGNITSNLNNQVQANSNMLSNISQTVVHSDEFIQGLKRFWLFRHTFAKQAKEKSTNHVDGASSPKQKK